MESSNSTSSSSSSSTPTIDVLTLLHDYQSLHASADVNLKSCFWNITKARRGRAYQTIASGGGKVEYTPEDIREELRAQAMLQCKMYTHERSDDNDVVLSNDNDNTFFVLHYLDGIKQHTILPPKQPLSSREESFNDQLEDNEMTFIFNSGEDSGGIRRRRVGNSMTSSTKDAANQWTTETYTISNKEKSDERLQNVNNPLTLFGVPPPALRVAQSDSKNALSYYVEVANLAREILRITTPSTIPVFERKP